MRMLKPVWAQVTIACFLLYPSLTLAQVMSGNAQMSGNARMTGGVTYSGSWSDYVRRATVAVGIIQKDTYGKSRFMTGATAVVIRDSANRVFIATALHVFDEPSRQWAPESLQIRGWRDEQKSRYEEFGSILTLRRNGHPLFTASKKFDLAIVPITEDILNRLLDKDGKIYTISPSTTADANDTYDGADVFILGFPALVGEEYQSRALMRSGIIAWTESSDPAEHEFLVDSRIFPGNSGGPVFSSAAGMTKDASIESSRAIKLLGIVSQTINAKPEIAFGLHLPAEAMVIGAAGVGVIEPAQELIALMSQIP